MIYWAKTDGTTLPDHVRHLFEERDTLLPLRSFVLEKYYARTGSKLDKMLHNSITWHDEGKKDDVWQQHCRSNSLRFVKMRHELVSLCRMHRAGIIASAAVRAAIAAHHGKLGRKHEARWKERAEFRELSLWEQFLEMGDRAESFADAINKRYKFSGPRAWLQLVDHRASAKESGDLLPEFRAFCYNFPYKGKERGVQKKIEELWNQPFAILRAPTGAGKTDAALLWARHQVEMGRADRLVFAMPTRFTANALAISKPGEISSRGLYHSTSRFVHAPHRNDDRQRQRLADKEQEMARLLETPITVTTLDHLCICLTGTREDHHGTFFNLAHSCVVIDEVDFYDAFTQQNIVVLLRALCLLNVPVLIMSATVPDSARQLYAGSGFTVPPIYEDLSDNERVRCRLTQQGTSADPEDVASLLERALNGEPTIIYANTVRRAQAYYRWFRSKAPGFTRENVVLYHSRYTEPHKERKERLLYEMLGKEAWNPENKSAHGVAILTQIGELSINISADLMISDLCPIDRLAQRAGRLARFHDDGGELFLVEPCRVDATGTRVTYPAPYGTFLATDGWVASEAFVKSKELLIDGEYSAKRFIDLVDQLYPAVTTELPQRIRANRRELEMNLIEINWLLLPAEARNSEKEQLEEDRTERWCSRDIPPQRTLYVDYKVSGIEGVGDPVPRSWMQFREFQLRHGVQCHAYEFNKAIQNGLLSETRDKTCFTIGEDDQQEIWTVPRQYYDFDLGLHLSQEESD
jgi:CRISPR-associated endonuclease/helicase Cas3